MKKKVSGRDLILVQILSMVLCLALALPAFALEGNAEDESAVGALKPAAEQNGDQAEAEDVTEWADQAYTAGDEAAMANTATSKAKTMKLDMSDSYSNYKTFKLRVTGKGYLILNCTPSDEYGYVYLKGPGYKYDRYFSNTNPSDEYIGVQKGTYTFKVKSGSYSVMVKYRFKKVKEAKYGTKKTSAKAIKQNKIGKGVITCKKKKVHWYKLNNTKRHKMKLIVNLWKFSHGGSYSGGVKMTVYFPNGSSQYTTLEAGKKGVFKIEYDTIGSKKARKGTYKVKIESYEGGNGYFTVRWK